MALGLKLFCIGAVLFFAVLFLPDYIGGKSKTVDAIILSLMILMGGMFMGSIYCFAKVLFCG